MVKQNLSSQINAEYTYQQSCVRQCGLDANLLVLFSVKFNYKSAYITQHTFKELQKD